MMKASMAFTASPAHRGSMCASPPAATPRGRAATPLWRPIICSTRRLARTTAPQAAASTLLSAPSAASAKKALLDALRFTKRGANASRAVRGEIEELQVALEGLQGDQELDYALLGGLWELRYTTADDVRPIIQWDEAFSGWWGSGPLQTGKIYQRFTTPVDGEGQVDNVIRLGLPLLEEREGVTLTVNARYEVRSGHRIALQFQSANVGQVRISPLLETLLTPAMLPRTLLQGRLLMALREFQLKIPFRNAAEISSGIMKQAGVGDSFGAAGGSYQLTYLDEEVLVGRASSLGSTFIFTRAEEF